MEIKDFVSASKEFLPEFLSSGCIVNGMPFTLDVFENTELSDFISWKNAIIPSKLYKYFPNKEILQKDGSQENYSIMALKNNTVYMQSPMLFDDVYDSEIHVDFQDYEHFRLLEYCKRCGINLNKNEKTEVIGNAFMSKIVESFQKYKDVYHIFIDEPDNENIQLSNKLFCMRLSTELFYNENLGLIIPKIIKQEYEEFIKDLKTTFRTSCFATSPFSQLMWGGGYADCHKGFCVEYSISKDEVELKELYENLFPMIYCKNRPNIAERLVESKDIIPSSDYIRDIFVHGALRKSIDWAYQNEWRLLMLMPKNDLNDYNVKFFPISKVYLGNRMPAAERKQIIDICKEKNIPYVGVKRCMDKFEMEVCEMLCENCPNYLTKNTK